MKNFIRSLYLNDRTFLVIGVNVILFITGFVFDLFLSLGKILFFTHLILLLLDIWAVFRLKNGFEADRFCPDRFSNGDANDVLVKLHNHYPFQVHIKLIDELPYQFQLRDFVLNKTLPKNTDSEIMYSLKPVKRGSYIFGALNIYVNGPFGLIAKRYKFARDKEVKVYPSFLQLKKYELMAFSDRLHEAGFKKVRKIGQNREFDQIRNYVSGDDVRIVNWKATARRSELMVNQYQDEKAQQIYSIIDKGRAMKMPFNGMTLLDYAINASLVLSSISLRKYDKAGLITFNKSIGTFLPASRKPGQLERVLETLYREKTAFYESTHEPLFSTVWNKINHRSLLFLYTNFESLSSLKRQLPFLRKITMRHLLVVVFFENIELSRLLHQKPESKEDIFIKTVAEKMDYEKRLIVRELARHGILSILTTPENLSVDLINKYLEIKARNLI